MFNLKDPKLIQFGLFHLRYAVTFPLKPFKGNLKRQLQEYFLLRALIKQHYQGSKIEASPFGSAITSKKFAEVDDQIELYYMKFKK
ncbi:hypothetical protein TCAL_03045 [Tigriopus californicus]|uniref:Uncharacterized protein n=1 Tax=Tigriopus californicus TaxID=6832 RepID=A0A553NTT1_TIGCA|nr:hypothetical protein TCAL_03045 [Tigriopus californicus]